MESTAAHDGLAKWGVKVRLSKICAIIERAIHGHDRRAAMSGAGAAARGQEAAPSAASEIAGMSGDPDFMTSLARGPW
ncbi:MAG: hypothetical protein U1F54_22165 [Burkholderiales bacterium]